MSFDPESGMTFVTTKFEDDRQKYGGCPVKFFYKNNIKGEREIWIEKLVIGDKSLHIVRKATVEDKHIYAEILDKFERGETHQNEIKKAGTPLEAWPACTEDMKALLNNHNCYTIEQLADLSEYVCGKIGAGVLTMRQTAKKYLENKADTKEVIAGLQDEIAALKAKLAEQPAEQKDAKESPKAPKRKKLDPLKDDVAA